MRVTRRAASERTKSKHMSELTETNILDLQGMHCASCVARIERSLKKVAGVADAGVNLAANRARVTFDPALTTQEAIIAAVEKAGYGATPVTDAKPKGKVRGRDVALVELIGAATLTLPVLALSMTGMDDLERPHWLLWLFAGLTTVVVFGFGRQFFAGAWNALRHGGTATMDTLVALGASASYFYSLAELIGARHPQVYFETASTIVTLIFWAAGWKRGPNSGQPTRSSRSSPLRPKPPGWSSVMAVSGTFRWKAFCPATRSASAPARN